MKKGMSIVIPLILLLAGVAVFGSFIFSASSKTKEGPAKDLAEIDIIQKEQVCYARCISCKKSSGGCSALEWETWQADPSTGKNYCTIIDPNKDEIEPVLLECT